MLVYAQILENKALERADWMGSCEDDEDGFRIQNANEYVAVIILAPNNSESSSRSSRSSPTTSMELGLC